MLLCVWLAYSWKPCVTWSRLREALRDLVASPHSYAVLRGAPFIICLLLATSLALTTRTPLPPTPLPALPTRPRSRKRYACRRARRRTGQRSQRVRASGGVPCGVARRLGCPRLRAGCQAAFASWGLGAPKPLPRRCAPKVACQRPRAPAQSGLRWLRALPGSFYSPRPPPRRRLLAGAPKASRLARRWRGRARPPPGAPTNENPSRPGGMKV